MRAPWPSGVRPLSVSLLLLSLGCQTLPKEASEPTAFADDDGFRRWFAYYYQDPKPDELAAAVRYMESNQYFDNYPDIASIFLANVMKAEPDRLAGWCQELELLEPGTWRVLVLSLWLVDTPESHALARAGLSKTDPAVRSHLEGMLSHNPSDLDLLRFDVVEPRHVNMLWAAFSATGDIRYVERVIGLIHLFADQERLDRAALGEAAIMTLAANALQHELVAEACDAANESHPDPRTRALIGAMLSAIAQIASEKQEGLEVPAH